MVIEIQPRPNRSEIILLPCPRKVRKVQRRQSVLKCHQYRQKPRDPAISLTEGMDQDQLHVHFGQGRSNLFNAVESAGGKSRELLILELPHQFR